MPTAQLARNTDAANTSTAYGWVERLLHWSIALLIVTAIALGIVAQRWAFDTDAALATKATLFSLHKTVGITILVLAILRILWAVAQPRPRPLHSGWEAKLAALVHWLLYGSLILVPLLGWAHHATAEGFAPILWPFGQSLPFLPKDADLSATLATLHIVFERVLVISLLLHVAGAVKHAVIDRDDTLARMVSGREPVHTARPQSKALPLAGAVVVWAAALGIGLSLGGHDAPAAAAVPVEAAQADPGDGPAWTVQDGTLSITVQQLGAPVTGTFADWSAAIAFDPEAEGEMGTVTVNVGTGSLRLGSVSDQATGPEFLAAATFPTARYDAILRRSDEGAEDGDGYVADGTFALRGVEVQLVLPFTLAIDGDMATMSGEVAVDRRSFGMGESYPDEASVGFGVTISVALTATRDG